MKRIAGWILLAPPGKGTRAPAISILGALFTFASLARADAVVTLCQTADDPGPGLNLRNAMLFPPNPVTLVNAITFQCNGNANIQISGILEIPQATSMDGGGSITLSGASAGMMVVSNPDGFYLYNLTLVNPTAPIPCPNWLTMGCSASVVSGHGVVELHNVVVVSSYIPISVSYGTLAVYNSQFLGNTGAAIVAYPAVTSTTIVGSLFQDNTGAAPIRASGSVSVSDTQFVNNSAMDMEGTCQLNIAGSTFQGNKPQGALIDFCGSTTITNSSFAGNSSTLSGGAIIFSASANLVTLREDRFLSNSSSLSGGALFFQTSTRISRIVSLLYSTLAGNHAQTGGAIEVGSDVEPQNPAVTWINMVVSSFSKNVATIDGGAIHGAFAGLNVARGVFADNQAGGNGGAVALNNVPLLRSTFGNALFVRNNAANGSAFSGDNADFINSTLDSNFGSVALIISAPRSPVRLRLLNTIVSNNPQGGCGSTGDFEDGGNNLQYNPMGSCGPLTVQNPHLDTMYIPVPESYPIGNGSLPVCMAAPINGKDVYGLGRPSGGVCTIGAAEGDINVLLHPRTTVGDVVKGLQTQLPFGVP